MSAVRLRRLQADFQKLQEFTTQHPRVQLIQTDGEPPERYQLQYRIKSLRQKDAELVVANTHMVEISLPRNYPRVPPQCRMLTPIFHPNIAPHAICIGDHWSPGEALSSIVARIGELIAYQSYNTKSPLNGEAARWTAENLDRLPLDGVSMLVEESAPKPAASDAGASRSNGFAAPSQPSPVVAELMESPLRALCFPCPQCQTILRLPPDRAGKQVRCPRCKAIARAPAEGTAS